MPSRVFSDNFHKACSKIKHLLPLSNEEEADVPTSDGIPKPGYPPWLNGRATAAFGSSGPGPTGPGLAAKSCPGLAIEGSPGIKAAIVGRMQGRRFTRAGKEAKFCINFWPALKITQSSPGALQLIMSCTNASYKTRHTTCK